MKAMVVLNNRSSGKVVARTEDVRFVTFEPLDLYEIGYGDILSHRDFLQTGVQKYRNSTNRQYMMVNVNSIGSTIGDIGEQGFFLRLVAQWWKKRRNSGNKPAVPDEST
jgi:hypothetical protein